MRHSKRDVLTTEDVRCALKLRSVEVGVPLLRRANHLPGTLRL
jgi:hypothetical protein